MEGFSGLRSVHLHLIQNGETGSSEVVLLQELDAQDTGVRCVHQDVLQEWTSSADSDVELLIDGSYKQKFISNIAPFPSFLNDRVVPGH